MVALSPPGVGAGDAVGRGRAPVPTLVGGTGKGRERPGERAGSAGWARWAGLACELGRLVQGGVGCLLIFCICLFLVLFFFFILFSFSVLIQFKIFMHSVKVCFLHLKYLGIICHTPNILVLMFENFYHLSYFEFDF